MNGEILFQNVFTLFIIAIILESSIMALFTTSILKSMSSNISVATVRDVLIIVLAFVLCYKVQMFTLFRGTGIKLPYLLDTVVSALVLARMTNLIREFLGRMKQE